jgi:hypothetical protein
MNTPGRVVSVVAAMFTATNAALVCFLVLGLVSERVPKQWAALLFGGNAPVGVAISLGVLVLTLVLVLRHIDWSSLGPDSLKGLLFALVGSLVGLLAGATVFGVAYHFLPRQFFSRGGDWDFDPLIEAVIAAIVGATILFWVIFRRKQVPSPEENLESRKC